MNPLALAYFIAKVTPSVLKMLCEKSNSAIKNVYCQFQIIRGEVYSTNISVQSLHQVQHSSNILIICFSSKQFLNLCSNSMIATYQLYHNTYFIPEVHECNILTGWVVCILPYPILSTTSSHITCIDQLMLLITTITCHECMCTTTDLDSLEDMVWHICIQLLFVARDHLLGRLH